MQPQDRPQQIVTSLLVQRDDGDIQAWQPSIVGVVKRNQGDAPPTRQALCEHLDLALRAAYRQGADKQHQRRQVAV